MLRRAAWLHCLLSGYLWLIISVPLGRWNHQGTEYLAPALLHGHALDTGDVFTLLFVTLPAILFWIAYRRRSLWFAVGALAADLAWLAMQIQSWWLPYMRGTNLAWQLRYAKGPTTKILPSFGNHVAPDGMHLVISVLLVACLISGSRAAMSLRHR